ncbi:MAG: aspartate-semialdehyde dehydrogenase [Deltaproteobacteria bacterium]|nr:aspartate-semialdehyde dehydrogenase [Deltaproteobacteria bacterium]
MAQPRVSVVGATGLVGRKILEKLEQRRFPVSELRLFSSERSAGSTVEVFGDSVRVEKLTKEAFLANTDIALASAGKEVSTQLREWARSSQAVVVDNSSAFRMDPEVPLVVPEINPDEAFLHNGYIANPNCSTIQLVVVLKPILDRFGLRRVVVSTYQSVSGAGQKGIDELSSQAIGLFNQAKVESRVFPRQIAFNAIPQIGQFTDNGYTDEEMKVTNETRKILGLPGLGVSCTAVRVPTFACHSESVMVETEASPTVPELRAALEGFPGLRVMDEPADGVYPVPLDGVEEDDVLVGRIRKDVSGGDNAYNLWIVADNILKGAALNAVQIAELLLKKLDAH